MRRKYDIESSYPMKSKFNDIVGRIRLVGLVHQLGNVIVIESGHFDR